MMFVLIALIAFLVVAGGFSKDEADGTRRSGGHCPIPLSSLAR